ncbi:TPA: tape measure protein [Enterobacter cloacae]
MVIRELLIRLGLTGSDTVGRGLDKVDGKVDKTIQSFSALGGVLATVFGAVTIANIAKTADTMQSLESRVGLLPQTVGDVGEAFDAVAKKATENRMGIQAYAEVYTRIGNAAQDYLKTSEEVEKVTSTLSQALVVGGATAQEQASAFLQFSQALGSGTLQGDEFRAMAEAAPQYLDQLAKALGYPRGELKKLASEGKLTTKEVIQATMNMSDYFNKMYKQIPMTIGQALVLVNNRWSMFINRLNRSSGAVTWVANNFLWMADKIEYALDSVIDALGGAENAVKLLGVALGAAGLVGSVYLLSAAFTALTSPVFLVIAALAALFLVGEDINSWLNGNKSLLGDMIGPVSEYTDSINSLKVALTDMKDMAVWALNVLKSLTNFFNSSQDKAQEWGDKLGTTRFGPWLKEKAGWLVEDLGKWASWGNAQTNGAFDIPRMWSDTLAGVRGFNQDAKGGNTLLPSYQSLSLPPPSAAAGPKIDVNIGNISVPAGTSDEQVKFLQDSAKSAFSDYGWNALGNTLNFNTGG